MDFDPTWLLIGLPVAFALGWIASRLDLRQVRREDRDSPRAYFKGLSLLLNEQQDQAIDAFIVAVQNDPETAELHFALGNLFRRRGEFGRAVRVHEHLLARADLKPADRDRAQHALAQDFMRAGLFDRAETAWRQLLGSAFDRDAQLALLLLHERSRDWAAASQIALSLQEAGQGDLASRLAHYDCELAEQALARGDAVVAESALERAHARAPHAARPLVALGRHAAASGNARGALKAFDALRRQCPPAFNLVAEDYAAAARDQGVEDAARQDLAQEYERTPTMALLRARLVLIPPDADPAAMIVAHLERTGSLSAAQALFTQSVDLARANALPALRQAIDKAVRPLQRYRCASCGFLAQHWFWQCPGCLGWDTFPPTWADDQ